MFKKALISLAVLIISFPAISSLFHPGYFPMHDDIQTMRLLGMDKCVRDLQIPCRWVPDMGYGYGYPQFNYYAPLPYYFMEIFHLMGFSIIDSVKIGFGASIVIAAFAMYLLAGTIWKSRYAGLLSALFYTYFPYHAVDVYVRGAMDEAWALSFMPLVIWGIYKVIQGSKNSTLLLALSVFGLATSHNISTLIFIPFCAVWLTYLLLNNKKDISRKILNITKGVFWGAALASYFLIPAWFEKKYVHVETITQGYFNYLAHFVGLKQLLLSSFWGYGSSELGNYDGLSLGVGTLWWTLPILSLVILFLTGKKQFRSALLFTLIGFAALFMVHPKSVFLWLNIGLLSYVQFPWRFLGPALFFFCLSIGPLILMARKKTTMFLVFFVALAGFYSAFFRPSNYLDINDQTKFSGKSWILQQTISIFDYLPVYAKLPPTSEAPATLTSADKINVDADLKGTNWRNWVLNVEKDNTGIDVPIFYFPGWSATDNGNEITIVPAPDSGIMQITLNSGRHDLRFRLKNTPVREISNIISLIAILGIPIYFYIKIRTYAEV